MVRNIEASLGIKDEGTVPIFKQVSGKQNPVSIKVDRDRKNLVVLVDMAPKVEKSLVLITDTDNQIWTDTLKIEVRTGAENIWAVKIPNFVDKKMDGNRNTKVGTIRAIVQMLAIWTVVRTDNVSVFIFLKEGRTLFISTKDAEQRIQINIKVY